MEIDSVSSFLKYVEETKTAEVNAGNDADFIFRGQDTLEPLIPRIARDSQLKPNGKLLDIERLVFREFERLSIAFTEFEPKDQWDLLALAQHHGLPTRFLDWSYSALTALWFCVQNSPKKDKNGNILNGVVWLFKTRKTDFINFPIEQEPRHPFSQEKTLIYRPRSITRRISAQTGIFTCHYFQKDKERFIPLEEDANYKDRLKDVTVLASRFDEIRKQLDFCGVNSASLFPDLDGLTKHLEFRYFKKLPL